MLPCCAAVTEFVSRMFTKPTYREACISVRASERCAHEIPRARYTLDTGGEPRGHCVTLGPRRTRPVDCRGAAPLPREPDLILINPELSGTKSYLMGNPRDLCLGDEIRTMRMR